MIFYVFELLVLLCSNVHNKNYITFKVNLALMTFRTAHEQNVKKMHAHKHTYIHVYTHASPCTVQQIHTQLYRWMMYTIFSIVDGTHYTQLNIWQACSILLPKSQCIKQCSIAIPVNTLSPVKCPITLSSKTPIKSIQSLKICCPLCVHVCLQ